MFLIFILNKCSKISYLGITKKKKGIIKELELEIKKLRHYEINGNMKISLNCKKFNNKK